MLETLFYILEFKKVFVGLSLSVIYITYYLVEVVKKPILICGKGEFRQLLEELPILNEYYWPTPWCVEARLQTVIGSLLRSYLMPTVQYRREIFRLSDGGQVALDWVDCEEAEEGAATLVVLPGLTGASHADYARSLALAARRLRAHAVVFNNRGLGGLPLTTPRLYCAVSHEDLGEVIAHVASARRGPVVAAGVSLGGLILGQYLAARGADAGLAAALGVSVPLDVERGAACIERPPLNALLSYHMARNLRRTVSAHAPLREGPWDWAAVRRSRTVREFDAAFTTKHFGFADVGAYYRAATLRDKLQLVRVPWLCLCAADDPFQPARVLPAREAAAAARVALAVPARGGHIGFLEGWLPAAAPDRQYIARLAEQYFAKILATPLTDSEPPRDDAS